MLFEDNVDLIVTIVKKGWGDEVLKATKNAGAEGGTIMYGRGIGIHEKNTILGMMIQPEKEVVLTVIVNDKTDDVLKALVEGVGLDRPGMGLAFAIPLDKVIGRIHKCVKVGDVEICEP